MGGATNHGVVLPDAAVEALVRSDLDETSTLCACAKIDLSTAGLSIGQAVKVKNAFFAV